MHVLYTVHGLLHRIKFLSGFVVLRFNSAVFIAQLVEHLPRTSSPVYQVLRRLTSLDSTTELPIMQGVMGSNPAQGSSFFKKFLGTLGSYIYLISHAHIIACTHRKYSTRTIETEHSKPCG